MTRPAPSCFSEDNTRAEGFSGHEIYSQMHGGKGTGSAQNAANKASELERSYAAVESRLKKVGETLGEAWSGASADAAQAAANPINQAMVQMQDALRQADHSLSNQVYQFNHNKAQLKNMPDKKPDTNLWDDLTPYDTDTEDAVNSYNSEESHNRKVYSEFQSASNTNRGELPKQFPGVMADTLNVEVINTGGDNGDDKTTNVSNSSRSNSNTGNPNTTGLPQGTTGTTWTPPTSTNGDQTTTSWTSGGDDGKGGLNRPTDVGGSNGGKPPVGGVIERPPNTGIPPIGVPGRPGLGGPGGPGTGSGGGRGGAGGGAGGGKFGGGGGGAGGSGRFGGGGLGGLGGGSGTGSSAGQQPGGKAGVFGAMGESGPGAGARGGAAGAGGRAGAAGMGGMGGQGQKGQGEDDLEHKSADYLINEENTNEIIGDMPMVAPPTIGG